MNLQPFCSTDPNRGYLHQPWSRGEFTYAANGHILVKVPRLADIPENPESPKTEKIFAEIASQTALAPLPKFKTPKLNRAPCAICEGRGKVHSCPSCACKCEFCDGGGEVVEMRSIKMFGAIYDLKYVRLVRALPQPLFSMDPPPTTAARFTFAGAGEGALMPMDARMRR